MRTKPGNIRGEEIMFRGYLQSGFSQRFGPLAGLLVAALLFMLRHTPAEWTHSALKEAQQCRNKCSGLLHS
jgi:hypothetical protein